MRKERKTDTLIRENIIVTVAREKQRTVAWQPELLETSTLFSRHGNQQDRSREKQGM